MKTTQAENWNSLVGLVGEIKRCEKNDIPTAALALCYICIDLIASLSRPANKKRVTRSDFIKWVDAYIKAHPDQPYKYRGKDVYAARCAFLHTYGSTADLHQTDPDAKKYCYHDGGKHMYDPSVNNNLVIIGTASFINDIVHGVCTFMEECQGDKKLRERVETRLPEVIQIKPL